MPRGRPLKTDIRERIAAILGHVGAAYGYQLYKIYQEIFGKINLRNLYYNLKKGLSLGEFIVVDVRREIGSFTWGAESQHIYYILGPYAMMHNLTDRQKEKLHSHKHDEAKLDFEKELNKQIADLAKLKDRFVSEQARLRYEEKTKIKSLIKTRAALLKDWMTSKFDKQKAHDIHIRVDKITEGMD